MSAGYLPLPMAAAVAYLRLVGHGERNSASEGLLDVVASALSVWVPLYGGEPRVRLADELVARGRLCNGATRLRFRDGTPPVENLAILQQDLEAPACASPTRFSSRRRGACRACCRLPGPDFHADCWRVDKAPFRRSRASIRSRSNVDCARTPRMHPPLWAASSAICACGTPA